jgi:diadenylate cyclase
MSWVSDLTEYIQTLVSGQSSKLFTIVLDIFIVSVIIYTLYMMLRKTRGIQLLIGLGIFWVLGFISKIVRLELLDSLIKMISPSIIFIIIIVLQPELRRLFADLSRAGLFKYFLLKPKYEIDEVVEAARIMSKAKTGALIVFTKDISLKDIIEQSVQLDAIISSSLLLTIFKKNSALHDGAVIIEQNRIASASSYLPMSNSLGSSTLGARHRSALGIAEETDAVVLVTSEETGDISICYDGEMIHPVKHFELKNQLLQFLEQKTVDTKKKTGAKTE